MAVKQYYYIDDRGYFANTGTGNVAHQAILDKMVTLDVAKYDIGIDAGKPIMDTKKVLKIVDSKAVQIDETFCRFTKPVVFENIKDLPIIAVIKYGLLEGVE